MVLSSSGKKSTIVFCFAAFLVILVVTFLANQQSRLEREIRIPFNDGVTDLSTYRNSLVAVFRDNQIYVWDWNNLAAEPRTGSVQSHQAALLKSDIVVSLRQRDPKALVVTSLESNDRHKEILIDSRSEYEHLGVSRNGSVVALLLAENRDNDRVRTRYEILTFDIDGCKTCPVVGIDEAVADSRLKGLAVSDDGEFIAAFGVKASCSWIVMVDVKQKEVMWEESPAEVNVFLDSTFSADGKIIYARGGDSTVYVFETTSGRLLSRLLPVKENRSTLRSQHIQTVAASADGRLVAAIIFDAVYAWDCKTGKKVFSVTPDHRIKSGIAVSPDSRFLATSDIRQGGKINIWRMPGL